MMREQQRALNRAMREVDRERINLQNQEKKTTIEIKKLAKQGQMVSPIPTATPFLHHYSFLPFPLSSSFTSNLHLFVCKYRYYLKSSKLNQLSYKTHSSVNQSTNQPTNQQANKQTNNLLTPAGRGEDHGEGLGADAPVHPEVLSNAR